MLALWKTSNECLALSILLRMHAITVFTLPGVTDYPPSTTCVIDTDTVTRLAT